MHPYAEDVYRTILDSDEIDDIIVEQKWLEDSVLQTLVDKYCPDEDTRKYLINYMDRFVIF